VVGYDVGCDKNARLRKWAPVPIVGRHRAGLRADRLAVFNTDQVEDVVERGLLPAASGKIVLSTSDLRSRSRRRASANGWRSACASLKCGVRTSEQVRQGATGRPDRGDRGSPQPRVVLNALFQGVVHIGKIGAAGGKLAIISSSP